MRSLDKRENRIRVCGQCLCGGGRWSEPLQSKRSANRKARKTAKNLCKKALTVQAFRDIVFIEREVISMHFKLTKEDVELLLSEMVRHEVEEITLEVDDLWPSVDFDIYKNGHFQTTIITLEED